MSENLPLFIIAHSDRGVTHYEHGRGRSCISIGGDNRRSVVRASGSALGPLGPRGYQSGKDPEEVRTLEW